MFRSAESWTVPNTDAGTVGDVRHRPAGVSCFKGIFCFVFHHVSRGQVECFCSLPQFLVGLNLLIAKQEILCNWDKEHTITGQSTGESIYFDT